MDFRSFLLLRYHRECFTLLQAYEHFIDRSIMPLPTTGEGIKGQVTAARTKRKRKEPSTSSNPWTTVADANVINSGAIGPPIIYISDDDGDEEENRIVKSRSVCELDSVSNVVMPAKLVDDTQRWSATTLLTFTVQCNACGKWRSVPSKEQYHDISDRKYERPWVCKEAQAWRENASCEDPSDISENEPSILWAVDETDIPKPPAGFARKVVVRGERSSTFADVYYRTPCGRNLRSMKDVQRFLDKITRYRRLGVNISQFSFAVPKPGLNVQKRPFKKVGEVWKRVPSDAEIQCSQPAITADPLSSCPLPSVYPQPLAAVDPTRKPVRTIK